MFSTPNPSFSSATGPGADAPKRVRPITSPPSPTYSRQPIGWPASMASLGTEFGSTVARQRHAPGGGRFVGIRGPDDGESRYGPQARELLDRLVGGAVFAHPDAVV